MPGGGGPRAAGARRAHRHGELRGRDGGADPEGVGAEPGQHREPAALHVAALPGGAHGEELPPALPTRAAAVPLLHRAHALTDTYVLTLVLLFQSLFSVLDWNDQCIF